jgi:hypothetical protein
MSEISTEVITVATYEGDESVAKEGYEDPPVKAPEEL